MEVLRVLHFKVCQNQSGEILQGVVREVKEETGIHTEFEEVRTFSHLQWSNSCFRLQ
ncbi:hypothetical protein KY285_008291 [Solanum tuberosum]|nr:hypothetical protein KY289_009898 [Solanum tuberosum]KAH0746634.1 hypothetical protein KY285_008291 [Solanum tuberosum]